MAVLSRREASIFACLADTLLAPAPPLPPIAETDAVAAFDGWLARAPRINRMGLRAVLLALELAPRLTRARSPWHRLPPPDRLAVLERLTRRGAAGRALVEALRASAAVSYYGDARVSALLGYTPAVAPPRVHGQDELDAAMAHLATLALRPAGAAP
jgi:hypothetical protein